MRTLEGREREKGPRKGGTKGGEGRTRTEERGEVSVHINELLLKQLTPDSAHPPTCFTISSNFSFSYSRSFL